MRSLPKRERCIIVTPLSRSGKPCRRSSVIGLPGRGCRRGKDVGRVGSFRVRILCSDCQKIRNRGFLSQTLAPPHIGPTEVPQKTGVSQIPGIPGSGWPMVLQLSAVATQTTTSEFLKPGLFSTTTLWEAEVDSSSFNLDNTYVRSCRVLLRPSCISPRRSSVSSSSKDLRGERRDLSDNGVLRPEAMS